MRGAEAGGSGKLLCSWPVHTASERTINRSTLSYMLLTGYGGVEVTEVRLKRISALAAHSTPTLVFNNASTDSRALEVVELNANKV